MVDKLTNEATQFKRSAFKILMYQNLKYCRLYAIDFGNEFLAFQNYMYRQLSVLFFKYVFGKISYFYVGVFGQSYCSLNLVSFNGCHTD